MQYERCLRHIALLKLASGNNQSSNVSPDSLEGCEEKEKSSKKKGLRGLFRHVSHSKHSQRNQGHEKVSPSTSSVGETSSPEIPCLANNQLNLGGKLLKGDQKSTGQKLVWDLFETDGSTRSSSLSGYETQVPVEYHIEGGVSPNLQNKNNANTAIQFSNSSAFPGQNSNSNLSSCAVSLSCGTPIMTVTNPTPEISHHKTFHSSPSRTHTHLSVHYNYENKQKLSSSSGNNNNDNAHPNG
ncbi:unnamed protein product [Trichobilharzia regenti]|nr:unnamed protein product [Trichobilharzia regenti]